MNVLHIERRPGSLHRVIFTNGEERFLNDDEIARLRESMDEEQKPADPKPVRSKAALKKKD